MSASLCSALPKPMLACHLLYHSDLIFLYLSSPFFSSFTSFSPAFSHTWHRYPFPCGQTWPVQSPPTPDLLPASPPTGFGAVSLLPAHSFPAHILSPPSDDSAGSDQPGARGAIAWPHLMIRAPRAAASEPARQSLGGTGGAEPHCKLSF